MQAPTRPQRSARPRKEAYFVSVQTSDDAIGYFNVTEHLGKPMPFTKPKATCAMRVTEQAITFSLLLLTKRTATTIAESPLAMPRGPLAKLERRIGQLEEFAADEVLVEFGADEDGKPTVYRLKISRDENNVAVLDMPGDAADVEFELPKAAVNLTLFLKMPATGRVIGVSFIGHLGKPEDMSTLRRAVSMALFNLSQLTEFRILSGIETVTVPSAPGSTGVRRAVSKPRERARLDVPVRLFTAQVQPVGEGVVSVEVDLENANPNSGRLLFHYTPSKDLEAAWETYRAVFDNSVAGKVAEILGPDDLMAITYDIVLGDVNASVVGRLNDALRHLHGLDLTPTQSRYHEGPAV
jgi:hypothetical protein